MASTSLNSPITLSTSVATTLAVAVAPFILDQGSIEATIIKRFVFDRGIFAATSNINPPYSSDAAHDSELAIVALARCIFGAVAIESDSYTDLEEGWIKGLLRIDTSGIDFDMRTELESMFYAGADKDDRVLSELSRFIVKFV